MKVLKALEILKKEQPVIVSGRTFEVHNLVHVILDSAEDVYWIRNGEGRLLSVDPQSEEVILFEELEEELEAYDETLEFRGTDYEFTYEEGGKVLDEDEEEVDHVDFKEYEADGEIIRIAEFEVSGEIITLRGSRITEDDLQEV
ncbi:hypothetical protein CO057_02645 [Candidatus Uhrbacteria bacterium CG_4_9_14_0_2_um_filter_41_50]|uniref:DUF4178 domain-containing protein n=1 Tax=Candidatus Uhrbacteria bacterium CG_4_9_14_0_2_um_filter_41_50 TaxID=1975031 RepID=A0A2M8EP11_9BACT|nr:MAG: hypothetical protein COZ45_00280 [Candidatus Uhrbacteria bacterium CG_4_10_14_3_um_filter_41_21]PIZ55343.1 MAG: hypothetical protein COY24_00750 [Candidatus Uhrbacteria bacterium CG_4_10_14_0_2_um_filter_41_21]PJB84566.1 MAG: hypothetical protein CO086_02925 [Candidatus Uhrbacteria bacterium CG_4_9_14_0_8_um_filter_41_16]PJC24470.1 MAG: hypothetical protein CO057_02645 [Candidatus Uhrbacteria bacterium CG_4_9_14_0_2_um_filter_41_50]PJE75420.1 MAG: hypothetical protein COV03_00220 [Candi